MTPFDHPLAFKNLETLESVTNSSNLTGFTDDFTDIWQIFV